MSRLNTFIIGTLLGDSYIEKQYTSYTRKDATVKPHGPYYNLRCEQVTLGLIEYKAKIWEDVLQQNVHMYKRQREPRAIYGTKKSVFRPSYTLSVQSKDIADYYNLLYHNGKKRVTAKTLFHLDEKGLAHWIMDDGLAVYTERNNTRRLFLCTDSFDLFGCKLICQWFSETFSVSAHVHSRKTPKGNIHYRIKFGAKDAQKVATLVFPYMLPEFYYKIFFPYEMLNSKRVIPAYREIYAMLKANVSQRKALSIDNEDIVC